MRHIQNLERPWKNYIASGELPWNHPTWNKNSYDCTDLTCEFTETENGSHREKDSLPWNTASMSLQSRMQQPHMLIMRGTDVQLSRIRMTLQPQTAKAFNRESGWTMNTRMTNIQNLEEAWNNHIASGELPWNHPMYTKDSYHCPDLTCEITETMNLWSWSWPSWQKKQHMERRYATMEQRRHVMANKNAATTHAHNAKKDKCIRYTDLAGNIVADVAMHPAQVLFITEWKAKWMYFRLRFMPEARIFIETEKSVFECENSTFEILNAFHMRTKLTMKTTYKI